MKIDLIELLESLARVRPVFHSEADFQHAFAWLIHQRWPNANVRLEFRPPWLATRTYLDAWIEDSDGAVAIELKYKTRGLGISIANETFDLLNQGAQDLGRYDFLKDVHRLEAVAASRSGVTGYAILLTNDSAYWLAQSRETVDSAFRLADGREIKGELAWSELAGVGTIRSRESSLSLAGAYSLAWRDYATVASSAYGRFRYLSVVISS